MRVWASIVAAVLAAAAASAQTTAGAASRSGEAAEAGRSGAAAGAAPPAASAGATLTAPSLTGTFSGLPATPTLTIEEPAPLLAAPAASAAPPAGECRLSCDLGLEDCLEARDASYWSYTTPEGYLRLSVSREDAAQCGSLQCSDTCE